MPQHQRRGARVELTFHEAFALLGQDDLRAAPGERAGRRDAEQAAADDDGPRPRPYGRGQAEAVVHGAERVHASGQFARPG